jgi:hypothetical protein
MSKTVNPFLLLNMGCEAVYVVDQRLLAQNISKEKGAQVLNATVNYLLGYDRLQEMFRPKDTLLLSEVRSVMEGMVNCSIMKITGPRFVHTYSTGDRKGGHGYGLSMSAPSRTFALVRSTQHEGAVGCCAQPLSP